jgi:hypothetical protein
MTRPPFSEKALLQRIRLLVVLFIVGVALSGATALPLNREVGSIAAWLAAHEQVGRWMPELVPWISTVREGLTAVDRYYPFLSYGTDWLAFGHFMIAIAFVGLWRAPVRNRWVLEWGMIACALVVPYALVMGGVRGIPFWWRLIDCSFGVVGIIPLWLCRRYVLALATTHGEGR